MKIDKDTHFQSFEMSLTTEPLKLAKMDLFNHYLLCLSENDEELVIIDVKGAFKDVVRIHFTSNDKRFDDLLKSPIKSIFVISKTIIILLNEEGLFRLIDFSIEKPSPWHVCELQKYLKFDFRLNNDNIDLPLSDKCTVDPVLRVTSKFNYGQIESVNIVR